MRKDWVVSFRDSSVFCGLVVWLSGLGFEFVAEFPAQTGLEGKLAVSKVIFPRQSAFGGFSDYDLNRFPPSKWFLRVISA
jgi:hypothetical protein